MIIFILIKLSEYPHDSKYLKEIKYIIAKTFPKYGEYTQNDTPNFAIDFNDKDDNKEINIINDNILYKTKKYKAFLTEFEK